MDLLRAVAAACLAGATTFAGAQGGRPAPEALVGTATADVLAAVKADRAAGRPARMQELVEAKILPLFDFPRMTAAAAGKSWQVATPAQQAALVGEFRILLLRTYAAALSGYRDWPVEFSAVPAGAGPGVTVRSSFRQPGAERLNLDYDMQATPEGWKVYDVRLAGISLVLANRETFASVVRASGIDGLVRTLAERNAASRRKTEKKL